MLREIRVADRARNATVTGDINFPPAYCKNVTSGIDAAEKGNIVAA